MNHAKTMKAEPAIESDFTSAEAIQRRGSGQFDDTFPVLIAEDNPVSSKK
jgi:hypothetical protein